MGHLEFLVAIFLLSYVAALLVWATMVVDPLLGMVTMFTFLVAFVAFIVQIPGVFHAYMHFAFVLDGRSIAMTMAILVLLSISVLIAQQLGPVGGVPLVTFVCMLYITYPILYTFSLNIPRHL